jgi:hypothetical protein
MENGIVYWQWAGVSGSTTVVKFNPDDFGGWDENGEIKIGLMTIKRSANE